MSEKRRNEFQGITIQAFLEWNSRHWIRLTYILFSVSIIGVVSGCCGVSELGMFVLSLLVAFPVVFFLVPLPFFAIDETFYDMLMNDWRESRQKKGRKEMGI